MTEPSRVVVAPSSRAAEAFLVAEIQRLRPPGDGSRPHAPRIRIVVPSGGLRLHLLARLAALRPAWLGIEVQTLAATASRLLLAAGEREPTGGELFPILLRRAAERRRSLASAFGDFQDGWALLAAAGRDLVDAGFSPPLAEALIERIEAERGALPGRALDRAHALIEAVADTLEELARLGLAPDSRRLTRAAELVAARGSELGGGEFVFLHGFADATGVASELLEALLRAGGACAILVDPPAVAHEGTRHGARLRERLEGVAGRAENVADGVGPPAEVAEVAEPGLELLVAPALEAESIAVARSVRAELDRGVRAEEVAIVVRDLGARRKSLARALERRGVPFSTAPAAGAVTPVAHRARALLRLLVEQGEVPIDAALELLDAVPALAGGTRAAVRLALRALGVARLRELGRVDLERVARHAEHGFPLPIRAGLETNEDGRAVASRRRVPVAPVLEAIERLRALGEIAARWPLEAPLAAHLDALRRLLRRAGLDSTAQGRALLDAVSRLDASVPPKLGLAAREAFDLFRDGWSDLEREGEGRGGGVQLLSVTEARGRTFESLFVVGLARGSFPRAVSEDPVLPDRLRSRLRELLPDLPVKSEGHAEERFLFAQLVGSSARIVLSRAQQDDDGRAAPPSPLLDALVRDTPPPKHEPADGAPEPAFDRAVAAGASDGLVAAAPHFCAALDEGRRRFATNATFELEPTAAARVRVAREFDGEAWPRRAATAAALGPYFGFLGSGGPGGAGGSAGSLGGPVAATTLEAAARCAWQAFLERTLKLEASADPLAALPSIDSLMVGNATHAALAELFAVGDSRASLADRLTAPPAPLAWPGDDAVRGAAERASRDVLEREGLEGRGLEPLLSRSVAARLGVARAEDERRVRLELVGSELGGELLHVDASGRPVRVEFRVDRVHREAERLVLVDWKSGSPPEKLVAKDEEKRRKNLVESILKGHRLQAAIYSAAVAPEAAEGRYVFLEPGDDPPERAYGVEAGAETQAALAGSLETLLDARRLELAPPRLLEQNLGAEYVGCRNCGVAEACVRGDSAFRLRLERWHARHSARNAESAPGRGTNETGETNETDTALWRLWSLAGRRSAP